jgi:hypothetical protein
MFEFVSFILFLLISASFQENTPIAVEESYRYSTLPHQFQCFSLNQKDLLPSTSYDIKISFLGTVISVIKFAFYFKKKGSDFKILWKNTLKQETLRKTFKFLDTEKLSFRTNQEGLIDVLISFSMG